MLQISILGLEFAARISKFKQFVADFLDLLCQHHVWLFWWDDVLLHMFPLLFFLIVFYGVKTLLECTYFGCRCMVLQFEFLVLKLCSNYLFCLTITLFPCSKLVISEVDDVLIQFFEHEVEVSEAWLRLSTQYGKDIAIQVEGITQLRQLHLQFLIFPLQGT